MRISDEGTKIVQLLLNHEADPNTQDEVYTMQVVADIIILCALQLGMITTLCSCHLYRHVV